MRMPYLQFDKSKNLKNLSLRYRFREYKRHLLQLDSQF